MKVYINIGPTTDNVYHDYTSYVMDETLSIEDSVNVPTVVNFTLAAADTTFQVPKRSSYVKVVSEIYAASGGLLQPSQNPLTAGKVLATGFITNELEREFLGLNPSIGYDQFQFQQHGYRVNVTSDEWLLNTNFVPFIPAFVNQTQGQILARVAQALRPEFGLDVTSFVASGDIVPYYQYNPEQTWSDMAKTFADSSRYRYKVIDKKLYFEPFGDGPLGISYDETKSQSSFDPTTLSTVVVTLPPVNDALVIGNVEAQDKWDNYFVGDGFTSNFQLRNTMFRGTATQLLSDDWTESQFSGDWTVQDPFDVFSLAGALNVSQLGQAGTLNQTYILGKNGVELGGVVDLQLGEVQFIDTCDGIVGGIYVNSVLTQDACVAGFNLSPSGSILVTASGVAGIIIQPLLNGQVIGPRVVSQPNHHYQLEIWIGAQNWSRYDSKYKTISGETTYGGNQLTSTADVTFVVTDLDLTFVIATQYNQFVQTGGIGPPIKNIPSVVTKYTASGVSLPSFGLYAPINSRNLNLVLNYTQLSQPPQGSLEVRSISGASGGLLPVLPQNLGASVQYSLGFGLSNPTATISQAGDSSQLSFFDDTIPGVGSRIRFIEWASGQSISRVRNTAAVAQEASVSGDDGVRSAIMANLTPVPRTSAECELAAAAVVTDRSYPEFQGTYNIVTVPYRFETIFNPKTSDYPVSGRYLFINSPVRAISGQNFFVNTVRTQVIELRQEVLQVQLSYGPDLYLEKLLQNFIQRTDNILTPKETAQTPTTVQLQEAGSFYVPMFASAGVTLVANSLTGNFITIDLGAPPVTAAEVRRVDAGWGLNDANLVGLFTSQVFQLPRTSRDQAYFIRPRFGSKTSRFSYVARINQPLIPSPPIEAGVANGTLTLSMNGDVRDIYGVELRVDLTSAAAPASITPPVNVPTYAVTQFVRNPLTEPDVNANAYGLVFRRLVTDLQRGDVVLSACQSDTSFSGFKLVNTLVLGVGQQPGDQVTWFEYGQSFPKTIGDNLSTAGQLTRYARDVFTDITSGEVINGLAVVTCSGPCPFNIGDVVLVGADWEATIPSGQSPSDTAFFTNQVAVAGLPASNKFAYLVRGTDPQNLAATPLNGLAARLLTSTKTVSQTVLIQRPVFAPSDLVFDLTDPTIKPVITVAQQFNPSGSFVPLKAHFFNLTWDYSSPLAITDVVVPSITGLSVDSTTQNVNWQIASGVPTGYRVALQDPSTGVTYSQFTVDNPTNPQSVTQFTLSNSDYFSDRTITVTPFSSIGDGISSTITHLAATPGAGLPNSASYTIGCTWDGPLESGSILVRVPLDQAITFATNFVPSQGVVDTAPTSDVVFTITRNGVAVGTMTLPAGSSFGPSAIFSGGPVPCNVGDVIRVVAPVTVDATAADFGFTLSATKGFINPGSTPTPGGSPQQLNYVLSDNNSINWADEADIDNHDASVLQVRANETLNNWQDFVPGFIGIFALTVAESLNNWSDRIDSPSIPFELDLNLSDSNAANWSDAMTKTLLVRQTVTASDSNAANWLDAELDDNPRFRQVKNSNPSTSSATYTSTTLAGSMLVAMFANTANTNSISSVTDSAGNTWVSAGARATKTGGFCEIWYCANALANAGTVTPNGVGAVAIFIYELLGCNRLDRAAVLTNGSASTSPAGPQVDGAGVNGDVYITVWAMAGTPTGINSPFTSDGTFNNQISAHLTSSGSQTAVATQNTSSIYCASGAAFTYMRSELRLNITDSNSANWNDVMTKTLA